MADYTLGVQIEGDASGLERAAQSAEKSIEGVSKAASGASAQNFAQSMGAQFQGVGNGIQGASKELQTFGRNMTVLTAPIAGVGVAGVKSFAEVDKTMQLTNKTMGNTAEEAEMLNKAMQDAASNSTFGMKDAAGATLNFARAGLDAEQAAAALAPAMNLAAGEGGNLDVVSGGLVATINGFGDSFENTGHYADVFAAACNNSALDVDSLSSAMAVAAPIFAASGKGVEDASLYMGLMANAGIDANVAANSLKTGLARLASPAKEGAEAMEALGISAYNADGTMKDSVQIQKELHDAFAGLSEQEQMAAASAIFGKNQMAPWLALINTAPEDVNELSDSIKNCNGTTDEMSEAMMSGFGGSIEKLKSSFDVLSTSVGEVLSKKVENGVDVFQKLVDKFLGLDDKTKDMIVTIGAVIAVIGPLAFVLGTVGNAVGGLITGMGSFITFLGGIPAALGAAFAPVVAVVAIIGLLVAAFVTLWNTNEEFRNKVTEIWTELQTIFGEFFTELFGKFEEWGLTTENFKAAWEAFCNFLAPVLTTAFDIIKEYVRFALDAILGLLTIFHGLFTGNWDEVWEGAKQILDAAKTFLTNVFGDLVEKLKEKAIELKDKIHEKFTELKDKATEKVEELKEKAKEKFVDMVRGVLCEIAEFVHDTKEKFEEIKQGVEEKIDGVKQAIEDGFNNAVDFVKGLIDDAWNWGSDLVSNIADGIWSGIGWITDAVSSIADTISSFLHFSEPDVGPLANFHTYMPDMMKQLAQGMKDGLPTLEASVGLVADKVAGVIPGTGTAGRYGGGDGSRVSNLGGVSIVVNGAPGQDEEGIADAVMRRIMDLVIADS